MKKWIHVLLACVTFLLLPLTNAFAANNSPLGYWKTIDDVTGKQKSIVKIYESGGALYGQVTRIWPRPGYDENEVCSACTGSRHNQKIVGMVIMEGLKQDSSNPSQWTGGTIMDPLNGKFYRCTITLTNNGSQLNVRGYIGISLFGRSQTWIRHSGPQ